LLKRLFLWQKVLNIFEDVWDILKKVAITAANLGTGGAFSALTGLIGFGGGKSSGEKSAAPAPVFGGIGGSNIGGLRGSKIQLHISGNTNGARITVDGPGIETEIMGGSLAGAS